MEECLFLYPSSFNNAVSDEHYRYIYIVTSNYRYMNIIGNIGIQVLQHFPITFEV